MIDALLVLAESSAGHAAQVEGSQNDLLWMITDTFGVNWRILLAQFINFGIVAVCLWKFAFKPVIASMDDRQQKISEGLQYAEEAKQQLASAEKEKAEKLRQANTESQTLVQEAKARAASLASEEKALLDSELAAKRDRALESIEQERQKVLSEARQDIARLVVLTSGRVLKKELSDEEKSRLNTTAAQEMASAS